MSFLSPASAILWYAMAITAVDNEVADPPCYELSVLRTRGHEAEDRAGECDRDLYDINYSRAPWRNIQISNGTMGWTTSHQRLVGDDAHDYVDILPYRDTVCGPSIAMRSS